ncbi:ribonuclease D [Algicella marina]|uniref:Ribonuclease D n=1 Tax=Algicella marina TaxID=2683284 RepID=A0A6P1SZR0_9RHOB|nr:ribonuclease D [Algicella marina]QHQ34853.1 ribonuclease D [Algicella marina]
MKTIAKTTELAEFCDRAKEKPFVTVDTEFLRERTYFAQLCLVQLAFDGDGADDSALVDVLADGLDLQPLYDLFTDPRVVKVFHAARQDLEIFYVDGGVIPAPLFDTQIAAMVCGFGEQVGYETLVRTICKTGLDKSSRFTDWSRRPLSTKQMEYAVADVTHLRDIYRFLSAKLAETERHAWVSEEVDVLMSPETYVTEPSEAWRRIKTRSNAPRFLGAVQKLAEYREREAIRRNVPRGRIFKDDVIVELAATRPKSLDDLGKSRLLNRDSRKGDTADAILSAIRQAAEMPAEELPKAPEPRKRKPGGEGLADLLRVLLKARAEETGVAQKLIASAADLEEIAASVDANVPAFKGWRRTVFGADALRLCQGEIALSSNGASVTIVEL